MNMSKDLHLILARNGTLLDEMTTATKVTLITVTFFIVFLGILGNTFVLIASLKYRAINIDRISILLVENLAAADLLIAVVEYLPLLMVLIADGNWLLGNWVCKIQAYAKFPPFVAENIIITTMACYRAHVVLNPPLVPFGVGWFYLIVGFAWIFPAMNCAIIQVTRPKAHFRPAQLSCTISGMVRLDVCMYMLI